MNEIGRDLIVTFANITMIVDNLEKHGCLKRSRETRDRRTVQVRLTQRGHDLWRKISEVHRNKIAELMHGLSKQELYKLISDTTKLRNEILESSKNHNMGGGLERRKEQIVRGRKSLGGML